MFVIACAGGLGDYTGGLTSVRAFVHWCAGGLGDYTIITSSTPAAYGIFDLNHAPCVLPSWVKRIDLVALATTAVHDIISVLCFGISSRVSFCMRPR